MAAALDELAGVHDPRGIQGEAERLRGALPGATVVESGALALACAGPARAEGVLAGIAGRVQTRRRPASSSSPSTRTPRSQRRWRGGSRAGARDCSSTCAVPSQLVLWDGEHRRGLLAQDQLGGRSLFTFRDGSRLCFATEIGVLLGLLRRRPDPDELALAHHLVEHSVPDGRMLYQGIRRLGGGCLLGLSDAGGAERRYWTPRYRPPLQAPRAELAARLHDELEAAVQDALPAHGGSALLLSGGLDSSVVAALAAPRAPDLQAIAAAFRRAGARRDARGRAGWPTRRASPSPRSRIEQREPLDAAEAYLHAWELPLPTPGIVIEAPLIAAAARLGAASCSTARAATSSSAPRTSSSPTACGACDRCRPGACRAVTRGWATTRRCVTCGACSRASASAGRSLPTCTSRSAGDGPRRATRRRGCVPAPPSCIATARTRGAGSSSTGRAGGPIWPTS